MNRSLRTVLVMLPAVIITTAQGQTKNGFSLADALVPADEVYPGGPPRDGIPAIDNPRFVSAADATFLQPGDRVLGIVRNGESRAYPVAILNWHEIVNDRIADEPVVVTYCPLCGTGIAYRARAGERLLEFGVSGLLYNSDMLLYDRETRSLWSQIRRQAVSGPLKGVKLEPVAVLHTRWSDWLERHPGTRVLSTETGYRRDYSRNPYEGYDETRELWFPVRLQDGRYHSKEPVLGVEIDGHFKAYPLVELEKTAADVHDELAGRAIVVNYDRRHRAAVAFDERGEMLPAVLAYWFAWYAFHPDTAVYTAD